MSYEIPLRAHHLRSLYEFIQHDESSVVAMLLSLKSLIAEGRGYHFGRTSKLLNDNESYYHDVTGSMPQSPLPQSTPEEAQAIGRLVAAHEHILAATDSTIRLITQGLDPICDSMAEPTHCQLDKVINESKIIRRLSTKISSPPLILDESHPISATILQPLLIAWLETQTPEQMFELVF